MVETVAKNDNSNDVVPALKLNVTKIVVQKKHNVTECIIHVDKKFNNIYAGDKITITKLTKDAVHEEYEEFILLLTKPRTVLKTGVNESDNTTIFIQIPCMFNANVLKSTNICKNNTTNFPELQFATMWILLKSLDINGCNDLKFETLPEMPMLQTLYAEKQQR